jgi:beta-carotene hydroxylase
MNVRSPSHEPFPDVHSIAADLTSVDRRATAWVLVRPFLCTLSFAVAATSGLGALTPLIVFALFVAIVTSAHDAVHGSLGLTRRQTDFVLFALGALVLESGHAYRATHLRHHAVFPGPDDPEGEPAHHSALWAVCAGPTFLVRLWRWAFRRGRDRGWLLAEATWALAVPIAALLALPLSRWPALYVALVVVGSWVYPLLTAHLPHRDFGATPLTQTHTLRGRIIPALFLELTYHLEHHLYPGVPTHRLAELSRRLEPYFARAGVEPWRVP